MTSPSLNQRAISFLAFSTLSEPWQTLRPCWRVSSCIRRIRACTYDIDGVVTTNGAGGGGEGVGGAEESWRRKLSVIGSHRGKGRRTAASLDGITALPDHGDDGAAVHVYWSSQHRSGSTRVGRCTLDEASEEWLLLEVGIFTRVSILGLEALGYRSYSGPRGAPCRGW